MIAQEGFWSPAEVRIQSARVPGQLGFGLDDDHPADCQTCRAGEAQRHTYEPADR